ncbi:hypothetical protein KW794_00540 [Candidatus Saccharibacteria bacterium]|nr:hypothetical protein [Candidatus Saccharibacteria bacterium]
MSRRYKTGKITPWSPAFAYCIGLLATDGCLLNDNRHIDFTSMDYELAVIFRDIIRPSTKIGLKLNSQGISAYRVQFSDVVLYDFLLELGLTPRKSKTINKLNIPEEYYADFLRGCFDGDGTSFGFWDKRWRSSYMYYLMLASASIPFLEWIRATNIRLANVSSGCIRNGTRSYSLAYAKQDSGKLFSFMYHSENIPYLKRKYDKILAFFDTDPNHLNFNLGRVVKSVNTLD